MMSPEQTLVIGQTPVIGESPAMIGGSPSLDIGGSVEVPLVIDETLEPLVTEQVTEPSQPAPQRRTTYLTTGLAPN
jgi:hypothetical protein